MTEMLQNTLDKMSEIYLKHIPNGYSNMKVRTILGVFGSISIGMIKEIDDCPHRIRDNDKAKGSYSLHIENNNFILDKSYHCISEIPRKQYYAMHLEKVVFRKITDTNLNKFLIKWENHVIRFKLQLIEAIKANRLYNQKEIKDIYLKLE